MIKVQRLSSEQFGSMAKEWTGLISTAQANPLFMGWAWQFSWWETWSVSLKLDLLLLAAYQDDSLVGLLPLYKHQRTNRLEFIGNAWRGVDTVRTEYCSSIIKADCSRAQVEQALVDYVFKIYPSAEVILTDLVNPTLIQAFENNKRSVLEREHAVGAKITTELGDFKQYLSGLSSSVRRKLYHRRKYLVMHNNKVQQHDWQTDSTTVARFFTLLNSFHEIRWGKACFQGPSLQFHQALIAKLNEQPESCVCLNVLYVNDLPVSVVYDIKMNNKTYNIQSGYVEKYDHKVSLGILHLGYQIEAAFAEKSQKYDFLLGNGKNSFYKATLTSELYHQKTYHVITNPIKNLIYSIYFNLPSRSRVIISSLRRLLKF